MLSLIDEQRNLVIDKKLRVFSDFVLFFIRLLDYHLNIRILTSKMIDTMT